MDLERRISTIGVDETVDIEILVMLHKRLVEEIEKVKAGVAGATFGAGENADSRDNNENGGDDSSGREGRNTEGAREGKVDVGVGGDEPLWDLPPPQLQMENFVDIG
ncbi:hypothetical protein HK097_009993, partial [Rhizophlyctis rosea]